MTPTKQQLRRAMRARRDTLPPDVVTRAGQEAAALLLSLPQVASAAVVALYASVRGELDTGPAARALLARGQALAFPRVLLAERKLAFHRVADPGALAAGAFGILEPPPDLPAVAPADIGVFVVPGLAFDARGGRVGWGHGYYDATLGAAPRAYRIGLAYEAQIVEFVPSDESDAVMDCVITETGIRTCPPRNLLA